MGSDEMDGMDGMNGRGSFRRIGGRDGVNGMIGMHGMGTAFPFILTIRCLAIAMSLSPDFSHDATKEGGGS